MKATTRKPIDAILLLHGLGGSPAEFKPVIKALTDRRIACEAPILPGHQTSIKDLKSRHWTEWKSTALEAFESLKRRHERVAISGLCMGAVLSLHLAAELGKRVAACVPISTTLFYDGWGLPWYSDLGRIAIHLPILKNYELMEGEPYGIKNPRIRKWIIAHMKNDSKGVHYDRIPLKSIHEMQKLIDRTIPRIGTIRCPVMAIHPIEDEVSSLKSVREIESRLSPKLFSKILLDDSYHLATLDNQREWVIESMIAFLNNESPDAIKRRLNAIA